jgi:phosphoesterase RecJ-like protein
MMFINESKILHGEIKNHDSIIILTHKMPDADAYGSQLGLFLTLKKEFPSKAVFAVATEFPEAGSEKYYTAVKDEVFANSLVIATDTPAASLINDERYKIAKKVIVIDHHGKDPDFGDIKITDNSVVSACEIVYYLIVGMGLSLDSIIAEYLMKGLSADSGRFRYRGVSSSTFYVASKLMEYEFDLNAMFNLIYATDLDFIRYKGKVMAGFETIGNVAFMKNTQRMVEASNLTISQISRGMVNAMADIKGIDIWANFTKTSDGILAEIRSKSKPVNQIAFKYGGGGHQLACGATLNDWETVDDMIKDLCEV